MLGFPVLEVTDSTEELCDRVRILATSLSFIPLNPRIQAKIFHRQMLKSSLFSARIEGNTLTLTEAEQPDLTEKNKSKKEIANVVRALQHIEPLAIVWSEEYIRKLHAMIMAGISSDAGKLRGESSAIYDQFGNMVYLTPSPKEMRAMFTELIAQLNQQRVQNQQLIQIAHCHYYFEKIHPFLDGNGRTGRVILQTQLQQLQLFSHYIIPIDQYFEEHRSEYYHYLEKNTRHIVGFVEFFLNGLIWSLQNLLTEIKQTGEEISSVPFLQSQEAKNDLYGSLLPRREEILAIIKDHPYSSLDMIARRFPMTPQRTLANDVQFLVKKGFVKKHGSTRGVRYSADIFKVVE